MIMMMLMLMMHTKMMFTALSMPLAAAIFSITAALLLQQLSEAEATQQATIYRSYAVDNTNSVTYFKEVEGGGEKLIQVKAPFFRTWSGAIRWPLRGPFFIVYAKTTEVLLHGKSSAMKHGQVPLYIVPAQSSTASAPSGHWLATMESRPGISQPILRVKNYHPREEHPPRNVVEMNHEEARGVLIVWVLEDRAERPLERIVNIGPQIGMHRLQLPFAAFSGVASLVYTSPLKYPQLEHQQVHLAQKADGGRDLCLYVRDPSMGANPAFCLEPHSFVRLPSPSQLVPVDIEPSEQTSVETGLMEWMAKLRDDSANLQRIATYEGLYLQQLRGNSLAMVVAPNKHQWLSLKCLTRSRGPLYAFLRPADVGKVAWRDASEGRNMEWNWNNAPPGERLYLAENDLHRVGLVNYPWRRGGSAGETTTDYWMAFATVTNAIRKDLWLQQFPLYRAGPHRGVHTKVYAAQMGSFVVSPGSSPKPIHQIVDLFELRLRHDAAAISDDEQLLLLINGLRELVVQVPSTLPQVEIAAAATATTTTSESASTDSKLHPARSENRGKWLVTCQVHGTHLYAWVWIDSEGKPRVEQLAHEPQAAGSSMGCNTVVKWKRRGLHSSVLALVHAGLRANEIRHDYYVKAVEGGTAYVKVPGGGDNDQKFALSRHQVVYRQLQQQQQHKAMSTNEGGEGSHFS